MSFKREAEIEIEIESFKSSLLNIKNVTESQEY